MLVIHRHDSNVCIVFTLHNKTRQRLIIDTVGCTALVFRTVDMQYATVAIPQEERSIDIWLKSGDRTKAFCMFFYTGNNTFEMYTTYHLKYCIEEGAMIHATDKSFGALSALYCFQYTVFCRDENCTEENCISVIAPTEVEAFDGVQIILDIRYPLTQGYQISNLHLVKEL